MPDMIFLSLSITTFYRKSFGFDSQVFNSKFLAIMMKSTSQGRLFLVSLLGFFCTDFAWSPVLLSLVTVVILLDVGRRITSYDTQDLINILVMYSALVCLQSHQTSSLWLTVFCLSPAQLLRSIQVKIFSLRESLFQVALLA